MTSENGSYCPRCRGLGFLITERGSKKCRCVYERFNAARYLNIPKRFEKAEVSHLRRVLDRATLEGLYDYLRSFENYHKKGVGLLFVGPPGVGKTYAAAAVLKFVYNRFGVRGYFVDTKELSVKLREGISSGSHLKYLEFLARVPVLVLDDLGNEVLTDWYRDLLVGLVSRRYNDKKTTFVTTNYYPSYLLSAPKEVTTGYRVRDKVSVADFLPQTAEKETLLDARFGSHVVSRLGEMTVPIVMKGRDKRLEGVVP
ncbi:MAG: ATP-binding protein [Aquificae bacterium]|nr:ATP-binding protein [Aquificota bacterium]